MKRKGISVDSSQKHTTTQNLNTNDLGTTRDGFGEGLREVGGENEKVVALCADLTESTRASWFEKEFPDRFFEVGVAEENMIGIAAGLAIEGKIPFAASYGTFIVNNTLGPIRASVCYSNLNVKIVGGHSGFSAAADGATHQATEDIATMRVLPNMTVVVPADQEEARKAVHAVAKHTGPCYLRTGKYPSPHVTNKETPFEIGRANILKSGGDITVVACGSMVAKSLEAAKIVENDFSVEVINMHTIKPLDTETLMRSIQKTRALISVEEHQKIGGLGSAIAEFISQAQLSVPFKIIGIDDTFAESGTSDELFEKYGLTSQKIAQTIKNVVVSKDF